MRNPLNKRTKRELRQEWGRYLAIFFFITLMIGFTSGMLATDHSMQVTYNESFKKYNIEDGHFRLSNAPDASFIKSIEDENDVKLYDISYKEIKNGKNKYRIFVNREKVNKASILDGRLPKKSDELGIDRLFAKNNSLKIGDTVKLKGKKFKIVGLIALSDYSALFPKNTDTIFNAQDFTVATVTGKGFARLGATAKTHVFAWKNNKTLSDAKQKSLYDDMAKYIAVNGAYRQINLDEFIPAKENQAIIFTGNDMGRDQSVMMVMLAIVMVIMAFIFAITTLSMIDKESKSVGTLLASGYTRAELTRHYMRIPILITMLAAILGNVMGYTYFKDLVAGLYYNSYSLPPYKMTWSSYAFYATTVSTIVIVLLVNILIISYSLRLSPLKFLRHDLKRKKSKNATKLPPFSFMSRFRLRVILQNKGNFLVLFLGVVFASTLMIYSLCMQNLFIHYKDTVAETAPAKYQYVLKTPTETANRDAEKICVNTLKYKQKGFENPDDIYVFGIPDKSAYYKNMPKLPNDDKSVIVNDGYLQKYDLKIGDKIKLKTEYSDKSYTYRIAGSYEYKQGLSVFMRQSLFRKDFDKDDSWFNSYLTNKKLTDIPESNIHSINTPEDYTAIAEQMLNSLSGIFEMIVFVSAIMSVILAYLVTKVILDNNVVSISLIKILGYRSTEIAKLYVIASAVVFMISLALSLPIGYKIMVMSYKVSVSSFSGWIDLYVGKSVYVKTLIISIASFVVSAALQFRHIKRIPISEALKNNE